MTTIGDIVEALDKIKELREQLEDLRSRDPGIPKKAKSEHGKQEYLKRLHEYDLYEAERDELEREIRLAMEVKIG